MVNHRRGPWSQHEDSWLINLVHRNGPHNWVRISQEIGTRSPKQCRERYHQNLKPSLNHDPITPEEGEQIERMVQEMGKRWAEIARRLKGRSDNAVKNWWNGGQNRRKRNPERADQRAHDQMAPGYLYSSVGRPLTHYDDDAPQHMQHSLPPPMSRESSEYYSQSRRPSLNPSLNSPHTLKLPQPHSYEPTLGSRPHPLDLQPFGMHAGARGRGYETPMSSPSGYSVVSADGAPSLITDTGSESRSPRGASSPLDITLAPLVGGRDERKNSCTTDDHHAAAFDPYRRRSSFQLPALQRAEPPVPAFREPTYRASEFRPPVPQLLTQPAAQLVHTHSHPLSAPLPAGQQSLPPFRNLTEPSLAAASPATTTPTFRQLPSPYARAGQTSESKSAPVSPRHEGRDSRMNLSSIL